MNSPAIVAAVVPVLLVTLLIGARGVAAMRTTSDFLVASRRISPTVNAAAVSGEYLSAASFLGIAGLVVKDGVGALWYPVGFAAGYVAMLALVAAPMRRTGALTVPDFADARLGSAPLRKLSALVVLVIGCLYLVPQFAAAGQVLGLVSGTPYWVGVVLAGAAVSVTLALGGHARGHLRAGLPVRAQAGAVHRAGAVAGAAGRPGHPPGRADPGRVQPVRPGHPGAVPAGHHVHRDRADPGVDRRQPDPGPAPRPAHRGGRQHLGVRRRGGRPAAGRRAAGGSGLGAAAARPRRRGLPAAGHLVGAGGHRARHDGPAAHPGPLPHQPRRPRRAPHGGYHRGHARRVLPVPRRVRAARRGAGTRAVPLRGHRHRGGGAAGQGRPGPDRVAVHRAAHRRRVRSLPGHLPRAAARGVRSALARPGARHPAPAAVHPARRGRGHRAARAYRPRASTSGCW